ncbi:UVR8-like protein [Mya arenaria]|uniref:UVR8-like protein n=1 Tax=Mya arenaria TaxID=6604 RepID=A0ABY7FGD5_MYAAR|nr:UVR8-like protein [Mya arenaria]
MCFDPTVTWLLVLTENGNLFIIPALPMLDPSVQVNHQWSVDDVTIVTCLTPRALPTHCVWWQTLDGRHIAIVATTVGELLYVDLERGCQVAERVVDEHIRSTELVQDDQQTLTSLLVYASDLHHNPLFVYQLPVGSLFTTLTDRVTFVASKLAGNQKLLVLSNQRAEISSDNYEEFNKESVLQQFEFSADEKLMSIFPKSFPFYWHEKLENDFSRHPQDTDYKQADNVPSALDIPLSSHTVIDGCIIVTENTVYECRPRVSPERLFLELCINQSDSSLIDQLGISLGLDLNILFERAAEYLLSQGVSKQATRLFHMSKGSPLLRVASFSKYGYIHEILPYIQQLLRKDESDISGADQHRLVELGLHGLVYRLTLEQDNTEIIQMFRKFVQDYTDYEEVQKLTVHLLTEAGAFLHLLATPHLIHIFCERPQLVSQYPDLLLGNLSDLDSSQLLEVAEGLDPSRPLIRGLIHRRLHSRHRTSSLISFTSSGDFGDAATNRGPYNQGDVRSGDAGRLVHCFLMIVLHLNKKRAQSGEPVNLDFLFTDIPEYLETLVSSQLQGPRKISCGPMPVGAGQTHGAAVLRNGDVYTWGKNNNGRLGHGDQKASSLSSGPGRVGTLATLQIRVTSVACGMNHTLALTQQGVYGWGWSKYGQVGLGTTHVYTRPMLIDSLTGVHCVAVDCGQYHSLALTDEAKVYSWGWGVHGQLGHGDTEEQLVPKCVSDLENQTIVKVAGGYCHSLVLNSKGEVYVFGSSFFGQLGQGNSVKHARPVKVSLIPDKVITMATKFFHSVAVTAKNTVYQWGSHPHGLRHFIHSQRRARQAGKPAFQEADAHLRPQRVDTSYVHGKIKQVVCGSFHSCLLTKNGEVYTWGRNLDGQLGNGTRQDIMVPQMVTSINDRHISHLVAGGEFNIAMDTDSQLFVWGRNEFCQLGLQPGDVKQTTKVIRVTGGSKSTGSELTEMLVPAPLNLWTEDEDDEEVTSLQLPNLQEVGPSLYDRMVIPILVKVLYHWQMESLLVPMLETFFSDRLPDFDVILATILFRKPDADKDTCEDPTLYQPSQTFLCQFSTSFCLKLSSNVLHKISTGDPRFMSSSALSAIKQLGGGSFDTIQKSMLEGDRLSYDHLWQDIIQNLEKGRDTRNYIYITHSELDRLCEQLSDTDQGEVTPAVFFTCGHYFTKQSFVNEIEKLNIESFVGGFRLPETLSVIKEYYGRKSCMPLACPKCVLGAILSIL